MIEKNNIDESFKIKCDYQSLLLYYKKDKNKIEIERRHN